MFQSLIIRVQQEVLEAVRDVMIGQELQIILIKLKLQRMLLQNLQRHWRWMKTVKDGERRSECMCVCDSWIVSSCCGFMSVQWRNDLLETRKNFSCPCGGKGQWYHHCQTQSRLSQQDRSSIVSMQQCLVANDREVLNIWGHLGLLAKTTAVLEMRHFYFQLLSDSPLPLLPFIALQTPGPPPNCLSCQAYSFKRQMQKLCVDVSVWEWVCATPGDARKKRKEKKNTTFSAVSISEWTQLSGPQLYEFHSWLHSNLHPPSLLKSWSTPKPSQRLSIPKTAIFHTEL